MDHHTESTGLTMAHSDSVAETPLSAALSITAVIINKEPRIRDIDLAERLGMKMPRFIRKDLIIPNRAELELYGDLLETPSNSGKRGRPGTVFYLNEEQALLICLFSRTAKAEEVRKIVIDVFMGFRHGHLEFSESGQKEHSATDVIAAARAWIDDFVAMADQKVEKRPELQLIKGGRA